MADSQNIKHGLIVKLADIIFRRCFFAYKIFYFLYKKYTDREKIKFLRESIKPGMTVLDIGANIGFYTVLLSRLVGEDGHVYAFEPDSLNYKYLESNTKRLKNVSLENRAAGAKTEKICLYRSEELNTRHQTFDSGEGRKFTEIDCVTIDDYFKKREKINFVKIDTEGHDYYAFSGMKDTLNRSENVALLGEFWPYGLKKSGVNPEDYITLLKDTGFDVNFFGLKHNHDRRLQENNRSFIASFYSTK